MLNLFIEPQLMAEPRGEDEGQHPSQGRAPVPCDQAAVRLHQGALPRAGEEHAQIVTLFALSNLWKARRRLIGIEG